MFTQISNFLELSIDLFKARYKDLLAITMLDAVISIVFESIQSLGNNSDDVTLGIILFVSLFAYIYFTFRLNIALILLINKSIHKVETSISEVFEESKHLFSKFFWTILKVSLFLIPPILLGVVAFNMDLNIAISILIALACLAVVIYLALNYGMATYASILQPEETDYLAKSKDLFKADTRFIITLYVVISVLTATVLVPAYTIPEDLKLLGLSVSTIVSSTISALISPIMTCIFVYGYWYLNSLQKEQEETISE